MPARAAAALAYDVQVASADELPPPLLKRVLTEHRARHERSLARLKVMTAALKKGGPPRLPSAVLRRGLAYQQLMLDWIDEVLTELRTTAAGR